MKSRTSPPLVCAFAEPPQNVPRNATLCHTVHEILAAVGMETLPVLPAEVESVLQESRILLTVGEGPVPDSIVDWVAGGGVWIAVGGTCGHDALFGVRKLAPEFVLWGAAVRNLGEGWIEATCHDNPIAPALPVSLHHFGGVCVEAVDAEPLARCLDAHGRPIDAAGIVRKTVGKGATLLIAPDVTGTIVRMQMGNPIVRDGVPAPDGTAPVGDGVLKSDDGIALDWLLDRQEVPGTPGLRGFLEPQGDLWREVVLRSLFWASRTTETPLHLLWYWPNGAPAIGHLSHDSDGNDLTRASELLDALDRAKAPGTWCVILPGYPPEMIQRIVDSGHELAMHYDSMTQGTVFSEREFDDQWRRLCVQFGEQPVTNKNHYLRWEGETEILRWCMARGIRMDQSKGASKTGACGFGFGTCHPFRPVDCRGRILDILELATPTQDLHVFAPETLAEPLLAAALRVHGVAHFLFHPAHMAREHVADSLVRTVESGRSRGMLWWTAAQIIEWNDARRAARWERGTLIAGLPIRGATVLTYAPWDSGSQHPSASNITPFEAWGLRFAARVVDLDAGSSLPGGTNP